MNSSAAHSSHPRMLSQLHALLLVNPLAIVTVFRFLLNVMALSLRDMLNIRLPSENTVPNGGAAIVHNASKLRRYYSKHAVIMVCIRTWQRINHNKCGSEA
ncbi:MAG TPA: hypothetical protein VG962_07725 [Steroidobacteraceae bacterium]|nr:hypothetical protein [Steroidobacteraceae bacterium]